MRLGRLLEGFEESGFLNCFRFPGRNGIAGSG